MIQRYSECFYFYKRKSWPLILLGIFYKFNGRSISGVAEKLETVAASYKISTNPEDVLNSVEKKEFLVDLKNKLLELMNAISQKSQGSGNSWLGFLQRSNSSKKSQPII